MRDKLGYLLEALLLVCVIIFISFVLIVMCILLYKEVVPTITKQPTVKCTDGNLYDVSYDGNITILEKRPFTTCEER